MNDNDVTINCEENCSNERRTRTNFGYTNQINLSLTVEQQIEELKKLKKSWTKSEMQTDDPNYHELKQYHDELIETLEDITTQKWSPVVMEVIDVSVRQTRIASELCKNNQYKWSAEHQKKLNELNLLAKTLKVPRWPWSADVNSRQGKYNHSRMQFLVKQQLVYRNLVCPQCGVTALLVGLDQIDSKVCIDCLELNRRKPKIK